jgi:hypothetical protein
MQPALRFLHTLDAHICIMSSQILHTDAFSEVASEDGSTSASYDINPEDSWDTDISMVSESPQDSAAESEWHWRGGLSFKYALELTGEDIADYVVTFSPYMMEIPCFTDGVVEETRKHPEWDVYISSSMLAKATRHCYPRLSDEDVCNMDNLYVQKLSHGK